MSVAPLQASWFVASCVIETTGAAGATAGRATVDPAGTITPVGLEARLDWVTEKFVVAEHEGTEVAAAIATVRAVTRTSTAVGFVSVRGSGAAVPGARAVASDPEIVIGPGDGVGGGPGGPVLPLTAQDAQLAGPASDPTAMRTQSSCGPGVSPTRRTGLVQTAQAPPSRLQAYDAPGGSGRPSLVPNEMVAEVASVLPEGVPCRTGASTSGAPEAPVIVQRKRLTALDLPVDETARTANSWGPSRRPGYVAGVEHVRQRPRSMRHVVRVPGLASHANVAERDVHGRMGAVVSTGRTGVPLADGVRRGS